MSCLLRPPSRWLARPVAASWAVSDCCRCGLLAVRFGPALGLFSQASLESSGNLSPTPLGQSLFPRTAVCPNALPLLAGPVAGLFITDELRVWDGAILQAWPGSVLSLSATTGGPGSQALPASSLGGGRTVQPLSTCWACWVRGPDTFPWASSHPLSMVNSSLGDKLFQLLPSHLRSGRLPQPQGKPPPGLFPQMPSQLCPDHSSG